MHEFFKTKMFLKNFINKTHEIFKHEIKKTKLKENFAKTIVYYG